MLLNPLVSSQVSSFLSYLTYHSFFLHSIFSLGFKDTACSWFFFIQSNAVASISFVIFTLLISILMLRSIFFSSLVNIFPTYLVATPTFLWIGLKALVSILTLFLIQSISNITRNLISHTLKIDTEYEHSSTPHCHYLPETQSTLAWITANFLIGLLDSCCPLSCIIF